MRWGEKMRIAGLSEKKAGWLTRFVYRAARKRLKKLPDPVTVMAHHGWVLAGASAFETAVGKFSRVNPKLSELAQIKTATLVGCPF